MNFYEWIDKQVVFLTAKTGIYRLGKEFFYEPTTQFYDSLVGGNTKALNAAMRALSTHIGSYSCPVIEEWNENDNPVALNDHYEKSKDEAPGLIRYSGPNRSKIQISISNKYSPMILGGILAHELTHHYLFNKGIILDDQNENEQLTDLATVYLGLGKLTINGYQPLTWKINQGGHDVEYTYQVGYLSPKELAKVFGRVCKFRRIPLDIAQKNLTQVNKKYLKALQDFEDIDIMINPQNKEKGLLNKLLSFIRNRKRHELKDRNFMIISCDKCGQKLRIPQLQKTLVISCSRCKSKFIYKR